MFQLIFSKKNWRQCLSYVFWRGKVLGGNQAALLEWVHQRNDLLAVPLSHICNLSFEHGVFPDKLKIAKILPVFKRDDPSLFSNYRPMSILPCLSKVFEKLFYLRLSGFLTKFNILNHHQYGFRPHHSTAMAILELVNNIYEGFENNQYTVGVLRKHLIQSTMKYFWIN